MDRDRMRASESDRQLVLDRLRQAVEDGRLDVAEYQQRIDAAMNAKVYSELDVLLSDLQRLAPPGYQDAQPAQPTMPIPAGVSQADELSGEEPARGRGGGSTRWRAFAVASAIAVAGGTVVIVVWPQLLLYIAIAALVVLVLFVLAALLGLF
ncbi:DUF1707 SHOCT-like domain-containing protein [Glycomyces xiaoerkulensis]|uniref:DUF1707 SHOCT-like domain-containing protein n=1 Tax=Glycomyces xiaoerkulensis TaxID=2038139 RepID=UPI000C267C3C|nr:DUF1707 domain-containing protein [Glycomyces xiaoerkulensis]